MMKHLESENVLCPQQHGFRKAHSCETQLLEFFEDVSSSLDSGKSSDIIVMDFAKAFDRVNHSLLIHKLSHFGIRGIVNRWIKDFLSQRSQTVVVEGEKSSPVSVQSGVPQGSVLGPSLFLLYINDLPDRVSSTSRLFADDTLLHNETSSKHDCETMQQDLQKLEQWEDEWAMKFHPDKCNVLPVTRSKNPKECFDYKLHDHHLEKVEATKYLGVTIQKDLGWDKHIENTCNKANKLLGMLRRNLRSAPTHTKETAYKALVRPVLEYSSCVWDPHNDKEIQSIEKIQRRAARFVLNRHKKTDSVTSMLDKLKWPTLQKRRKLSRLSMFYKIHNGLASFRSKNLKPLHARQRRGHDQMYQRVFSRRDYRNESFLPKTVRDWNALPSEVVQSPSLGAFTARASKVI